MQTSGRSANDILTSIGALTTDWANLQLATDEANSAAHTELHNKKQEALAALSMLDDA